MMEALSSREYWDAIDDSRTVTTSATAPTIVSSVRIQAAETDGVDDDGQFFDFEFTDEDDKQDGVKSEETEDGQLGDDEDEDTESDGDGSDDENDGGELNCTTLASRSRGSVVDLSVSLSPSDDLFFKGRFAPIEHSSMILTGSQTKCKSKFHVSLLKPSTKFRVLMMKLKKLKSNVTDKSEFHESTSPAPKLGLKKEAQHEPEEKNHKQNKFSMEKLNVEEFPIFSLFTRDNSSKSGDTKTQKRCTSDSDSEVQRFSKDAINRYLKMLKPLALNLRASTRRSEKLRHSTELSSCNHPPTTSMQKPSPAEMSAQKPPEVCVAPKTLNIKGQKQGNIPARLRVVYKRLGKCKSASSAEPQPAPSLRPAGTASRRLDDSILQDGIQSAILHCKRSLNASEVRSTSDPLQEKSMNPSTVSSSDVAGENINLI